MTKAPPKLPKISADELNSRFVAKNALEALGIKFTAVTEEYLEGSMPVDARTHQPFGFLHGGPPLYLPRAWRVRVRTCSWTRVSIVALAWN